jgi:NAD(P)-dependent dehydrogenase (short-subunit alcohol dehydrogenase family)
MGAEDETLIWISGATQGLGLGLALTVPYPNARIINISRRPHPHYPTVLCDLTEPDTYVAVFESFEKELSGFRGRRAIFIHNAYYQVSGYVSETKPSEYVRSIQANAAAPMILGDMFLRAVKPGYEAGLVMMSSAAARVPYEGLATYCAAKAGMEMWVRTVKRELKDRGRDTWLVAVRPGFVDTPAARLSATLSPHDCKVAPMMAKAYASGNLALSPQEAGRQIWAALPPKPDESVLLFGEMVSA